MKALIVFSGYNPRGVVAFLRTLEKNEVAYAIIASSENDDILLTDYASKVLATRKQKKLDMDDLLSCINLVKNKLPADKYVIAPSTEALNRYLIENCAEFGNNDCEIPLTEGDMYEKISNKQSFGNLCKTAGRLVPEDYDEIPHTYPFVAKPKKYFASNGKIYTPRLIFSEAQASEFKNECDLSDFYYQEYIEGDSLYLLYYFYKNGSVVKLSQQNFVQQPEGKSIIAAEMSDFHESDESARYEEFIKSLGFSGLVMIEVKRSSGKNYMIEANPRFWGPSQLFVDAGTNLFEDFLFDNGVIDKHPNHQAPKPTRYFWEGGLKESDEREVYYSCSAVEFSKDFAAWHAADIYNRDDTKRLYRKEMGSKSEG
jgi:predicted ATP-grasp superfamily ATP-dependent carboligase